MKLLLKTGAVLLYLWYRVCPLASVVSISVSISPCRTLATLASQRKRHIYHQRRLKCCCRSRGQTPGGSRRRQNPENYGFLVFFIIFTFFYKVQQRLVRKVQEKSDFGGQTEPLKTFSELKANISERTKPRLFFDLGPIYLSVNYSDVLSRLNSPARVFTVRPNHRNPISTHYFLLFVTQ